MQKKHLKFLASYFIKKKTTQQPLSKLGIKDKILTLIMDIYKNL